MKQYVIDEFRLEDFRKVKDYLEDYCKPAGIDGVYWLEMPEELMTEVQAGHTNCQPYHFALELDEYALSCGFLVRATGNIRCHCIGYADVKQREWLLETIDSIMEKIGVIV